MTGNSIHMNRSRQRTVLIISGLAFLLAVVLIAVDARLALGAAGFGGTFVAWAVVAGITSRDSELQAAGEHGSATHSLPHDSTAEVCISPGLATTSDLVNPRSPEPPCVMEALLSNAHLAGAPVAAHLWLEDIGTPTLRLVCAHGPQAPDPTPVPTADGLLGAALASGEARCERTRPTADRDAKAGWRYAFPFTTDEASGVSVVDFVGRSRPDLTQMTRVTSAMHGSLAGSLALHVARSEACTARQLLDTASELSSILTPDEVVTVALDHALALSNAETGSVMLLAEDGTGMRIVRAHGLPREVIGTTRVCEGDGISGWVLSSGRPLVVEDLDREGPPRRRHGVLSAVSVPISDDRGVLGVLNVGNRRFHARLSRTHVRALEAIGRMTATALRNARAVTMTQDLFFDTLKALALALETRDPYSRGGTARVMRIAESLGEVLGLGESDAYALRLAVLLHDIGMSAVGDAVAVTSRPLTTVEWAMLKMHPQIAAEILSQAPLLGDVIPLVYHHHEHYDGNGYGDGLAGDGIPLGARILSVADAFVAMTSSRPYRSAMSSADAMAELTAHAGTQFDPAVVDALVDLMKQDADTFSVAVE